MRHTISTLILLLLMAAPLHGQTVVTGPFHLAWTPNPEPDIAGYRTIVDNTISDVGNVTEAGPYTVPPGSHVAAVLAYNQAGQSSQPSAPVNFTMTGGDPCVVSPITIVVTSYTTPLVGGNEGQVVARAFGPAPITRLQVTIDQQVIGEITGTQLTWIRAIGFATPRATGTYNLLVTADDNRGCHVSTTAARPLVIQ